MRIYLASPAQAQRSPLCDSAPGLLRNLLHDSRDFGCGLWWSGRALEEGAELLTLLLGVRRIPAVVSWLTKEEVRYKDLVLVMFVIGMSKDVGTLHAVNGLNEGSLYEGNRLEESGGRSRRCRR